MRDLVTGAGVKGIGSYLWARFARLYPLFLLMMLIYVLVSSRHIDYWTGHPERLSSTFRALPYFIFSVQSWFYVVIDGNPLLDAIGGASPITWSISTEWFFYFLYLAFVWLVLKLRTPPVALLVILLWCLVWTAIATGLYDRTDQINAWAVAHFGPVADVGERPQDSFVRWLLYFSPYLRLGEFVLGALVAQLYAQLRSVRVSTLENSVGAVGFVAAAASAVAVTYVEYSPNVGTTILREMNMNFALAPSAAAAYFLRRSLSRSHIPAVDVPAGHGARRGKLLDISRPLGHLDGCRQVARSSRRTAFCMTLLSFCSSLSSFF